MKRTTLDDQTGRTEYVDVAGGRIACEVVGHGPLVVLSPGRQAEYGPAVLTPTIETGVDEPITNGAPIHVEGSGCEPTL